MGNIEDLVQRACEQFPSPGEERRGRREIAVDVSPIVAHRVRLEREALGAGGVRSDLIAFYRKERDTLQCVLKECRYHGRTQVLDEERCFMVVMVRPEVFEAELSLLDRHLSSED